MVERAANRLLKPEVLARLGQLDLVARTVVEGLTTGMHRSPHFGFSQEFAEYRAYNEGDDLRYVDWNVYARTDRTYVKRFEGETNTTINLLLDTSASMKYGEPVSKIDQARYLLASLAYIARKQHDAIGLVIFDTKVRDILTPSARPDSLHRALSLLEKTQAGNATDINEALSKLQASTTRKGLVVLVSDLYTDAEQLLSSMQPLAHAGQDIAVFHLLDQREIEPELETISALKDLETAESVIVDPEFLRSSYRSRFSSHCKAIENTCRRIGADYKLVRTSDPLDAALQAYLRFRERRGR
ncbi:MAG: DUF58 domain-containing protein [Granulosicoccus sp.]|nr:DUF58 domain-containing protein [Granulosicoccus sp.]